MYGVSPLLCYMQVVVGGLLGLMVLARRHVGEGSLLMLGGALLTHLAVLETPIRQFHVQGTPVQVNCSGLFIHI